VSVCLPVCLSTKSWERVGDCLQIFRVAPGRPANSLWAKKFGSWVGDQKIYTLWVVRRVDGDVGG